MDSGDQEGEFPADSPVQPAISAERQDGTVWQHNRRRWAEWERRGGSGAGFGKFPIKLAPVCIRGNLSAASAIAATNKTLHARNDVGGGVVYLRSGAYAWLGANQNYGATPNCNIEVATYPGDLPAVISSATSQENTLSGKVKLKNLNITSGSSITFTGDTYFWVDECTINATAAALFYGVPVWYVTRCAVSQLPQGFFPFSTQNSATALMRGNITTAPGYAYTVCGNVFNGPIAGECLATDPDSHIIPYADGAIIYNNAFYAVSGATGVVCKENYYKGPSPTDWCSCRICSNARRTGRISFS